MTSDLRRRVLQHKQRSLGGFTAKYRVNQLVYFEAAENARAAIAREKQIKALRREKKLQLIEAANAGWLDLAANWLDPLVRSPN